MIRSWTRSYDHGLNPALMDGTANLIANTIIREKVGSSDINAFAGRREQYLKLAEALRALAERDVSQYGIDHDHFEGLTSADGKVRVHLILRIADHGASSEQPLQPGIGLRILSQIATAQISNHPHGTTVTMSFPCRQPNVPDD